MQEKQLKMKMRLANQAGFTLMELMIVIAVLVVLASIVAYSYNNSGMHPGATGKATAILKEGNTIKGLAEVYQQNTNNQITSLSDLVTANLASQYVARSSWQDTNYTGSFGYAIDNSTYTTQFGTPAADEVLVLVGVDPNVCLQIANQVGMTTIPAGVQNNVPQQCFGTAPNLTYLQVLYQN